MCVCVFIYIYIYIYVCLFVVCLCLFEQLLKALAPVAEVQRHDAVPGAAQRSLTMCYDCYHCFCYYDYYYDFDNSILLA